MAVSGASRYLVSSQLANEQGRSPSTPTLIGGGSAQSILDAAKTAGSVRGIGLSSNARSLNSKFLSDTGSQGTALLGLTSGSSLTTENLATQIKALRSSLPKSQISPLVLAAEEAKAEEDAEKAAEALRKEAESLVSNERGVSLKEYEERLNEAIRILEIKQNKSDKPAHTSFRRGLTLNEQA